MRRSVSFTPLQSVRVLPVAHTRTSAPRLQAFMNCANSQSDISMCTAFNDNYKECKIQYGLQ